MPSVLYLILDPFVASIPIPDATHDSGKLINPVKWVKQHAGLLVMVIAHGVRPELNATRVIFDLNPIRVKSVSQNRRTLANFKVFLNKQVGASLFIVGVGLVLLLPASPLSSRSGKARSRRKVSPIISKTFAKVNPYF